MKTLILSTLILFIVSFTSTNSAERLAPDDLTGIWWNAEKNGKIKIFKAQNGKYAGKTIWLKEPNDSKGNPKVDDQNPDPKLRTVPRLDLPVLKNFVYNDKSKKWEDGTIYDPKNGKTYDGYLYFEGNQTDKLSLRGYIMGMSMMGRTAIWERDK